MSTVFLTGFPGFLGSRLLPPILSRSEEARAVCLIQSKFAELSRQRVREIGEEHPELAGRIELIEGDITLPGLGLEGADELMAEITEIYHLAAIYDLGIARDIAMKINVDGTRFVLDFAEGCPGLERFQYVSTCYVSGRYAGAFTEDDLEKGQEFNNFYEETKFLAELEVQKRMARGLPATIYRPSIVVGDSRTGETQKFDGPYFVMQWLLRQPPVATMPVVGDPKMVCVNLVPSDFIIRAIGHLSQLDAAVGKVYHLADPEPLTVHEILRVLSKATRRTMIRIPLPLTAAKFALSYVPFVERVLQIPSSSIDYFVHPTHYTTTNTTEDLEGTGITVPPFPSYVDRLVAFMKRHPKISSKAMR